MGSCLKDKASFKKLKPASGRALNRMKLSLKKFCEAYRMIMEEYRKNPVVSESESSDGSDSDSDSEDEKDSDDDSDMSESEKKKKKVVVAKKKSSDSVSFSMHCPYDRSRSIGTCRDWS